MTGIFPTRTVRAMLAGATVLAVVAGCGTAGATATPSADDAATPDPPTTVTGVAGAPLVDRWNPPADLPAEGTVTTAEIPGVVSGFAAADAWIYLPPAFGSVPRGELPTLVLMSGQPGAARDWFDDGDVEATMDAYADRHEGLAPVVVVPDWLGTAGDDPDPLCVDSTARGADYSYLTVDVHDWIVDQLGVDPDPAHWAVGGSSAGGTCAMQIAVRDPAAYPTVIAFSIQDHPVLEDGTDTLSELFDDDPSAYDAIDPMAVLAAGAFPDSAALFAAGSDDGYYGPQTRAAHDAAEAAGMNAQYATFPGGHDYTVWSRALAWATPWLGTRLGITP